MLPGIGSRASWSWPATVVVAEVPTRPQSTRSRFICPNLAGTLPAAPKATHLAVTLRDADFDPANDRRRHSVTVRELKIPERALRDYVDAQHDLEKRDVDAAEKHLEHAVELAPQFANAWNTLGTIAYQTRRFPLAEHRFRRALRQDPTAYESLVNLGGVLVTLHKLDEPLEVNVHATLTRPNDALANSQFGMTYSELGQFDSAVNLERAPARRGALFASQLFLAEIHFIYGAARCARQRLCWGTICNITRITGKRRSCAGT